MESQAVFKPKPKPKLFLLNCPPADRVRVLEEAVQGARHLSGGHPRGARHRGARQEGRLLLPGDRTQLDIQWTNVTRFVRIICTNIRQIIRTDIRLGNWPLFVL